MEVLYTSLRALLGNRIDPLVPCRRLILLALANNVRSDSALCTHVNYAAGVCRYWAPTRCQANNSAGGGFCSQYTQAGYPAATNLALHGTGSSAAQIWTPP